MKAGWARAPSGWAEPVTLTDEQREMIRVELAKRRLSVFRDAARQDAFLRRIERAMTYLRTREGVTPDPHRSQERITALHKALVDATKAIERMGQPERAVIEHGQAGQLAAFAQDVAQMQAQAERAADALAMPRGGHDPRPGGHVRLLVQQTAEGWQRAFERKPSAKPDGAFFAVVNIVLGQIGHPEIGKDALQTILKGAGFKG
ncbi:MAG: hypothetical protein LC676_18290 [Loktanella sp.]|nr:hypothetical protein [Loktanella sp.]